MFSINNLIDAIKTIELELPTMLTRKHKPTKSLLMRFLPVYLGEK